MKSIKQDIQNDLKNYSLQEVLEKYNLSFEEIFKYCLKKNNKYNIEIKKKIEMSVSKSNTSTGLYRVSKSKRKDTKQGYLWEYTAYVDGKRKKYASTNLNKLYEKIIANGLDWIIVDEDKAKKSYELNDEYCLLKTD